MCKSGSDVMQLSSHAIAYLAPDRMMHKRGSRMADSACPVVGFRSANGAYYNPLAGRARRASDGAAPVYG